jgi:hypothetical protein
MARKLTCDVCGKRYETLGSYSNDDVPWWWICGRCFTKADVIAASEDRWPDAKDFARLKVKAATTAKR